MIASKYRIKIATKITEFARDEWCAVFPPVLESYDFFKTLDESRLPQFSFFYIMMYDGCVPVAATSCFTMDFPLDISVRGRLRVLLRGVKKIFPRLLSPKVLLCGLPMGQGHIGMRGDEKKIADTLCGCMEDIAKKENAPILIFKDFNADYDAILKPVLRKGFHRIESLPSTDIDIRFGSFEEFLKTLSPVSRSNIKRNLKKVDGHVSIDCEIANHLTEEALAQAYVLYTQTLETHDDGLERLSRDFFKNISHNMPQETRYFLWRIEGRMVAFAFCLVSKNIFIDHYLGLDYSLAHKYHLYFVRFRDLMNWCISQKIKKYEMGPTGYEPKRRMGFHFIRLYFYIKMRPRFLNACFHLVCPLFKPENFNPVFTFEEMKNI